MTENEQKVSDSVKLKINRQLALMEAALYVAGRPLDLKTLAKIAKALNADLKVSIEAH